MTLESVAAALDWLSIYAFWIVASIYTLTMIVLVLYSLSETRPKWVFLKRRKKR